VRVIKRQHWASFCDSRKGDSEQVRRDFSAWHQLAKNADWKHFGALKQTFGSADLVGDCVVFDVGNNRYRLVGRVRYQLHVIYVLKVMDHKEYDKNLWIEQCGCNQPPPKPKPERSRP
jgi:mRNA interferase HigB